MFGCDAVCVSVVASFIAMASFAVAVAVVHCCGALLLLLLLLLLLRVRVRSLYIQNTN